MECFYIADAPSPPFLERMHVVLANPAKSSPENHPLAKLLADLEHGSPWEAQTIRKGLISAPTLNPIFFGYAIDHVDFGYDLALEKVVPFESLNFDSHLPTYGVADTPQQAFAKLSGILEAGKENYCIFVNHIPKNDLGLRGWRWHKWGPYIGVGKPTREYLSDEEDFENGVYIFQVYRVLEVDDS